MEGFIGRCVESTIIPSIADIDVIVVNDGSTDGSHDIAAKYAEKYPDSIRVVDKPNGHYGTTINRGLAEARGKYFRILDADDYFEKGQLEAFVKALKTCDADLVVTGKREESLDDGTFKEVMASSVEYGRVYDYPAFNICDHTEDGTEYNMHTMTYKTKILRDKKVNLPGGVCYTDMLWCLIPLDAIRSIVIYDIILYHYIIGREGSSTTRAQVKRNMQHICVVLNRMFDYCNDNETSEVIQHDRVRYMKEAVTFFYVSIMKHNFLSAEEYRLIEPVINNIKKYGLKNRLCEKYYVKPWIEKPSRCRINFWLTVYKLGHPFK